MREQLQAILDRALSDMCKQIDPLDVLRELQSGRVLSAQQIASCQAKPTPPEKVEEMVRCLKFRDDSYYEIFRQILIRLDYQRIVNDHLPPTEGTGSKPIGKDVEASTRKRTSNTPIDDGRAPDKIRRTEQPESTDLQIILQTKGTAEYLKALARQAVVYPPHWTSRLQDSIESTTIWNDGDGKKVALNSLSDIYQEVEKLVTDTWTPDVVGVGADARELSHTSIAVKRIWRIENPLLYDRYLKKKKQICHDAAEAYVNDERFPPIKTLDKDEVKTRALDLRILESFLVPQINEYFLLHGTKEDTRAVIIKQGLDSRVASGTYFGKGIYFAESSTKSDQYADIKKARTPERTPLYMFVVRVLLGNPYLAPKPRAYVRAPCTQVGCNSDTCKDHHTMHDSVVGVNRHDGTRLLFREFVVYDSSQSYPEYLVEYIRL